MYVCKMFLPIGANFLKEEIVVTALLCFHHKNFVRWESSLHHKESQDGV